MFVISVLFNSDKTKIILNSLLQGIRGKDGKAGEQGPQGPQGLAGLQGRAGPPGARVSGARGYDVIYGAQITDTLQLTYL